MTSISAMIQNATSPDKLTSTYNEMSSLYNTYVCQAKYEGPLQAANTLALFYPKERKQLKILDIGAGTGFLGIQLRKLGFCTIDGLDPSRDMLDKAVNVYNNIYCDYFTSQPTPGLTNDSYDAIVSSGSFLPGHIPAECLIEAVRLVKKGGLICIVTRTEGEGSFNDQGYADKFRVVIKQLKEMGNLEELKWKKVYYNKENEGVVMLFRILK